MKNQLKITFLFSVLIVFVVSCGKKSANTTSNEIMSKNDFVSILIDIHKFDAILTKESLFDNKLTHPDSLSYYNEIFKKHNVTREVFYNTMYHYLNNINKFMVLEQIVIDTLKAQHHLLDSLYDISSENNDLWNLKRSWKLPDDGVTNSIPFSFPVTKKGNYTISIEVLSYPDDLSKDLKMIFKANYADQTKDSVAVKIITRNTAWKEYSLTLSTNMNKELLNVEGEIFSHAKNTTYMHLDVKDIKLLYVPYKDAQKTDSIAEPQ